MKNIKAASQICKLMEAKVLELKADSEAIEHNRFGSPDFEHKIDVTLKIFLL